MKRDIKQGTLGAILAVNPFDGLDVLEIGCGDGDVTGDLAGRPKTFIAIDPDETCLASARCKVPGVDFRAGSGECLDFSDQSFDLVLFSLSLHHQNGEKALPEAYRVLKNDGRLLVIEPAVDSPLEQIFNLVEDETPELKKAMETLHSSPFHLLISDSFIAEYEFDDRHEFHQWMGENFGRTLPPEITDRMDALLGDKALQKPLIIEDKNHLLYLKK